MSTAEPSSQGSPLWRFSLRFYRQPEVADACIRLQEEAGVDVNLLLFLFWHATRRRALSAADVAELERRIGAWRDMTVVPLRKLRRALKSPPGLVAPATAEGFRTRIKAAELEAERLQQEAMYELARSSLWGREAPSLEEAARANVAGYAELRGTPFPKTAIETLLAALIGLERKSEE
ncbi:MAG: TIGR02444 family protein [Xanthobacteraceae bacterium]